MGTKSPIERPRRLRKSASVRGLIQATRINVDHLVWPVFVTDGSGQRQPIASMPGQVRYSPDTLVQDVSEAYKLGIRAVAVFPKIDDKLKTSDARECLNPDGLVPRVVRELKKTFPDLVVITDIALDPFSSDGHDGLVRDGTIINDETVQVLAQMSVLHAKAGADFVAPSDMMDGRVGAIRTSLDRDGLIDCGIIAYCSKYASCFYGPFRDALDSAPRAGDKLTYQMNPMGSAREALREARLDIAEGADILMVKPALAYLDIISLIRANTDIPIAAYQVSGEYSMLHAAAQKGWLDLNKTMFETTAAIHRAGADMIFTYFARDIAKAL